MPNRLPIKAAEDVALKYDLRQVIVLAWDGKVTHVVTFGKTLDDCSQAADGANRLKEKWGWPECNDQPSRVKKLQSENDSLQTRLAKCVEALQKLHKAWHDPDMNADIFDRYIDRVLSEQAALADSQDAGKVE